MLWGGVGIGLEQKQQPKSLGPTEDLSSAFSPRVISINWYDMIPQGRVRTTFSRLHAIMTRCRVLSLLSARWVTSWQPPRLSNLPDTIRYPYTANMATTSPHFVCLLHWRALLSVLGRCLRHLKWIWSSDAACFFHSQIVVCYSWSRQQPSRRVLLAAVSTLDIPQQTIMFENHRPKRQKIIHPELFIHSIANEDVNRKCGWFTLSFCWLFIS